MKSQHDATGRRSSGGLSPMATAGTELREARETQGFSIESVAAQLLLSTRQVRGLESGDVRPFHNGAFFRRALTKYSALLGVSLSLDDLLPGDSDESGAGGGESLRMTLADCTAEQMGSGRRPSGRWLAAAIVAGLLILLVSYALARA